MEQWQGGEQELNSFGINGWKFSGTKGACREINELEESKLRDVRIWGRNQADIWFAHDNSWALLQTLFLEGEPMFVCMCRQSMAKSCFLGGGKGGCLVGMSMKEPWGRVNCSTNQPQPTNCSTNQPQRAEELWGQEGASYCPTSVYHMSLYSLFGAKEPHCHVLLLPAWSTSGRNTAISSCWHLHWMGGNGNSAI